MTFRLRLYALLLALSALPAIAAPPGLRPPDAVRMGSFDAHLGNALRQAYAGASREELALLTEVLSGPVTSEDPTGDWNCRTIKLGEILPMVAYGNFRCRISVAPEGTYNLEKLTGSQRTRGSLVLDPRYGGWLYLGVGHVGTEPATDYDGLPRDDQTPVGPNQTHADVGLFEVLGPNRARLMLPDPILESRFDILYFTR